MIVSKNKEIIAKLNAKIDFLEKMPKNKPIYKTPKEYAKGECVLNFSHEKYDNDEDYREEIQRRMEEYNLEAEYYNGICDIVLRCFHEY